MNKQTFKDLMLSLDFYALITEHSKIPAAYRTLSFMSGEVIYNSEGEGLEETNQATSIKLFPLYLNPRFISDKTLVINKVPQKKITGYAIDIKDTNNIENFLAQEYSKSFRSNIRRLKKRLETCFTISYRMFFGSISQNDYNDYMNELHRMLTIRFGQRNENNDILNNWDFYFNTTFELVNSKKASIFVIYENNIPIYICINHHFNNILFVSIPSYDIDYSKFALGNISIYKLLEWAIDHNYSMIDMAYGTLEYKRRWSNLIYDFEHHILFDKNQWKQRIFSALEIKKIQLKNILKHYNIDDIVKKIKSRRRRQNSPDITHQVYYNIEELHNFSTDNISVVDIYKSHQPGLKQMVFEFLYAQKAHIKMVEIFKTTTSGKYVIKLKDRCFFAKITSN
ncbi:GNAT family N-acetyltransferase [Flavobacteriaceae bacterium GSB9]|nr:GNAT family N-acetyltransferase [Flavobacteriaceae bacterium GSB9]